MGARGGRCDMVDGKGASPGGRTAAVVAVVSDDALVGMASRCGHVTVCGAERERERREREREKR